MFVTFNKYYSFKMSGKPTSCLQLCNGKRPLIIGKNEAGHATYAALSMGFMAFFTVFSSIYGIQLINLYPSKIYVDCRNYN